MAAAKSRKHERAIRAGVSGALPGTHLRDATAKHAREAGLLGWVRQGAEAEMVVHAEGDGEAIERLVSFLGEGPQSGAVETVDVQEVKPEGHEQFAIRGISAGVFVVAEHQARSHHFDLRLEVEGAMRSWAVPKGPSMDPAVKRMAIEVEDHSIEHNDFEGELGAGYVRIWDRGTYEQGGRVPWPEALDRGHAVFVLRGDRLRGGFALQRTRGGEKPQWLLIKRSDEEARRGSDVTAKPRG